jgi:hypothetical protein
MTPSTPSAGQAPGLPGKQANLPVLTRRALLAASPALVAPALLAAPALADAQPADPLPALWAECQRAEAAWLAAPDETPEADALWHEFRRIEDAIEETVATTPAGLLAQLDYMAASYGSGSLVPEENTHAHDVPLSFLDTLKAGLGRL